MITFIILLSKPSSIGNLIKNYERYNCIFKSGRLDRINQDYEYAKEFFILTAL